MNLTRETRPKEPALALPSSGKRHANRAEYEKQWRHPGQTQVSHSVQIEDRYHYSTNQEKDSEQSQDVRRHDFLPQEQSQISI